MKAALLLTLLLLAAAIATFLIFYTPRREYLSNPAQDSLRCVVLQIPADTSALVADTAKQPVPGATLVVDHFISAQTDDLGVAALPHGSSIIPGESVTVEISQPDGLLIWSPFGGRLTIPPARREGGVPVKPVEIFATVKGSPLFASDEAIKQWHQNRLDSVPAPAPLAAAPGAPPVRDEATARLELLADRAAYAKKCGLDPAEFERRVQQWADTEAQARSLRDRALALYAEGKLTEASQLWKQSAQTVQSAAEAQIAQLLADAQAQAEKIRAEANATARQDYTSEGKAYDQAGKYQLALDAYRAALATTDRATQPREWTDAAIKVISAHNAGSFAPDPAMETLARDILALREKELGPEHPDTLVSRNNLAGLLDSKGDYAAAQPLYEGALEARERVLGKEHPDTLNSRNNLALLLSSKGDYAAAQPLLESVLEARERTLGKEHPDTLSSRNNLAFLLYIQGDYAAAQPLYESALEVSERVLGKEHPDTLASRNNLALLLCRKGDYAAAQPLYEGVLEARERTLGHEHPATLQSRNNLAGLLCSKGDYAAAQPLYESVLEASERTLGHEHPATLQSRNNLAALLFYKGDYAAAQPLYESVLKSCERTLGKEHPDTLSTRNSLALLLASKGNYAAAQPLYESVLETRKRTLGKEHPDTLLSAWCLAAFELQHGDKVKAGKLFERTLEAVRRVMPEKSELRVIMERDEAEFRRRLSGEPEPPPPVLPGYRVTEIIPDGQAAKLDIRVGDVLTEYAGRKLDASLTLPDAIQQHLASATPSPTAPVALHLLRGDKDVTLQVAPGKLGLRSKPVPAP